MTTDETDLQARLKDCMNKPVGPIRGWHKINRDMVQHWCDAMDDRNPIYLDDAAAQGVGFESAIAPPSMLQVWVMRDFDGRNGPGSTSEEPFKALSVLDAAGYEGVMAVNYEQTYLKYLNAGDSIYYNSYISEVSDRKETGVGVGYFVTETSEFFNQNDEKVAEMLFRLFKYKAHENAQPAVPSESAVDMKIGRVRPVENHDSKFFWEGVRAGKLLVQKCVACSEVRYPPAPMCSDCQSLEWEAVEASGKGTVYSYVVMHHPPIPPFDYPNIVGLIELPEGTRIISQIIDAKPDDVSIGDAVELVIEEVEEGLSLPLFKLAKG